MPNSYFLLAYLLAFQFLLGKRKPFFSILSPTHKSPSKPVHLFLSTSCSMFLALYESLFLLFVYISN